MTVLGIPHQHAAPLQVPAQPPADLLHQGLQLIPLGRSQGPKDRPPWGPQIRPVRNEHVKMHVQVQCAPEPLHQRHRPALPVASPQSRIAQQVCRDRAVLDPERRALDHAPCAATRAKAAAFAAECDEFLCLASLASHAQKSMLEPTTLQIVLEFALNMAGQRSPGGGQVREKARIVLFDDLIQQSPFGSMAHMSRRCRSGCRAVNCPLRFHALRHPLPKGLADAARMRHQPYSGESAHSGCNHHCRDARRCESAIGGSRDG